MFGFAGPIHHATHHSDFQFFDPRILVFPDRHAGAEIALDLLRHFLEESAGGATATGAGRDLWSEAANSHRLQNLLANKNLFSAIAVRSRCKRYANGIANAFLQKHREPRRAADNALCAHAGFGKTEMERVIAL